MQNVCGAKRNIYRAATNARYHVIVTIDYLFCSIVDDMIREKIKNITDRLKLKPACDRIHQNEPNHSF